MRNGRVRVMLLIAAFAVVGLCGLTTAQAALKDGLVAYYPFDEGAAVDRSGYGNHGTIALDAGITAADDGIVGKCMNFTGAGAIVVPDANQINLTSSLSLQVWVNTTSVARGGLFGKSYGANVDVFPYYLELLNDRLWPYIDGAEWINAEAEQYVFFGGPIATGAWRHLVATFDDDNDIMRVYIDGVYMGDGGQYDADISDEVNAFPLLIGALNTDGGYIRRYIGKMDEVAIWKRVLSAEEISKLYNDGKGMSVNAAVMAVSPADNAKNVKLDESLEWTPNLEMEGLTYDLYLVKGTDPNLLATPVLAGTTVTSYAPCCLDYSSTYIWRVDTYEPNDPNPVFYKGSIWTFNTIEAVPLITAHPTDQSGAVSKTVRFTVEGYSVSPIRYAWYRDGDSTVLSTSDILDVTIADENDEAGFYCVLTNDAGEKTSNIAYLTVERLIAHWAFEENLNDPINGWNGINRLSTMTEEYDEGILGRAIKFTSSPNNHSVVIPGSNDAFPEFMRRNGYTFTCWVKTSQSGWAGLMNMVTRGGNSEFSAWSGMGLALGDGTFLHQIKGGSEIGGGPINDGKWHFVVGAFDAKVKKNYCYIDGRKIKEANSGAPADVNQELMFGNEMTLEPDSDNIINGALPLVGLIDEARVYNYALSSTQVAALYADITGPFCVSTPEFDVSGPNSIADCVVDIYDFATFASDWMACNLFPTCVDSL